MTIQVDIYRILILVCAMNNAQELENASTILRGFNILYVPALVILTTM